MSDDAQSDRRRRLIDAVSQLSSVQSIEALIITLRGSARAIGNAEGITIVRREGGTVTYVAEDAVGALWSGQSFPIESCISGLAILENRPILIPDIYADDRVPHDAYLRTFVRSMAMFPIGVGTPDLAIGAYWSRTGAIDPDTIALLSSLARAASMSFERLARTRPAPRASSIEPLLQP